MRYLLLVVYIFVATNAYSQVAHSNLTPNSLKGTALPEGYDRIDFYLADGNWKGKISLPKHPQDMAEVSVQNSATYACTVTLKSGHFNVPLQELVIKKGMAYLFTYNAQSRIWKISGDHVAYLTANGNGSSIENDPVALTIYSVYNGNWTSTITLPKVAKAGDIAVIQSNASWKTTVNAANRLYAQSATLYRGDQYVYTFNSGHQKWILTTAPKNIIKARFIKKGKIPALSKPRTDVWLWNGNYTRDLYLPSNPHDRDTIAIHSSATYKAYIDTHNVREYNGKITLNAGDEYTFMYIAENHAWEVTKYPTVTVEAKDLKNGHIPFKGQLKTVVNFANANWTGTLFLPSNKSAQSHTRVIVQTSATYAFNVVSDDDEHISTIHQGETVAFVMNKEGKWERETVTIDILLVYSDKAAKALGESKERSRMVESFRLTNEALENSGANFRLRTVGLEKIKAKSNWVALGDPLRELRDDKEVQALRKKLHADAIYYEGTEVGCGLAYVKSSAYNMVATGSLSCGTTVMRHEFGHNMGLNHGVKDPEIPGSYARGYSLVGTAMGGNATPYYATPNRYTSYGAPRGVKDRIDGVRAMNEFSHRVANYY